MNRTKKLTNIKEISKIGIEEQNKAKKIIKEIIEIQSERYNVREEYINPFKFAIDKYEKIMIDPQIKKSRKNEILEDIKDEIKEISDKYQAFLNNFLPLNLTFNVQNIWAEIDNNTNLNEISNVIEEIQNDLNIKISTKIDEKMKKILNMFIDIIQKLKYEK